MFKRHQASLNMSDDDGALLEVGTYVDLTYTPENFETY
jgi:hypothetical protein